MNPLASDTTVSVFGLGSAGCRFLADLPVGPDLAGARFAIDSDDRVLESLEPAERGLPVLLKLPRGRSKLPDEAAAARVRAAWDTALPQWLEMLPASTRLVLVSVALGGVTGTTIAPLLIDVLRQRKLPMAALVLQGEGRRVPASRALEQIAEFAVGLCLVNPELLGAALGREVSVQKWMGLCSLLRLGHAMDWRRVAPFLVMER